MENLRGWNLVVDVHAYHLSVWWEVRHWILGACWPASLADNGEFQLE